MSPRKARYRVPEHIAQAIREKRRNLLHGPYNCPKCGKIKLRIQIDKKMKEAAAICSCGLQYPLKYFPPFEPIDYYNKLIDQLNKKK